LPATGADHAESDARRCSRPSTAASTSLSPSKYIGFGENDSSVPSARCPVDGQIDGYPFPPADRARYSARSSQHAGPGGRLCAHTRRRSSDAGAVQLLSATVAHVCSRAIRSSSHQEGLAGCLPSLRRDCIVCPSGLRSRRGARTVSSAHHIVPPEWRRAKRRRYRPLNCMAGWLRDTIPVVVSYGAVVPDRSRAANRLWGDSRTSGPTRPPPAVDGYRDALIGGLRLSSGLRGDPEHGRLVPRIGLCRRADAPRRGSRTSDAALARQQQLPGSRRRGRRIGSACSSPSALRRGLLRP